MSAPTSQCENKSAANPERLTADSDSNSEQGIDQTHDTSMPQGYAESAWQYVKKGWTRPVPLPEGRKQTPPSGFSGRSGLTPSGADIQAWVDQCPGHYDRETKTTTVCNGPCNIALVMPPGVIGIDVDHYLKNGEQKVGGDTLAKAEDEKKWGPLPTGPRTTRRPDDPISGIRFYRVPEGVEFDNIIDIDGTADVEVIQPHHRYALVAGSVVDGKPYGWQDAEFNTIDVPAVAELPELPAKWVEGLRREPPAVGDDFGLYDVNQAFTQGDPHERVSDRLARALEDVRHKGSRYDNTRHNVLALMRSGRNGLPGVRDALITLGNAYVAAVVPDRPLKEAVEEYTRMIHYPNVEKLLAVPSYQEQDEEFFAYYRKADNTMNDNESAPTGETDNPWGVMDGAQFILDAPKDIKPVWGEGNTVLWADGEGFMLAGMQGLGKTTLGGRVLRGLLGLDETVLGLPFADTGETVLYLAMDRPRQIQRSMARQFTAEERETLKPRVIFRPGPPLADLSKNPEMLRDMMRDTGASIVIVDSLKDAAVGLSDDEVGAGYNRARQYVLADGRNIMDLHHMRKAIEGRPTINDIYGSTWLTSGCGSVVILTGQPGDPIVGFYHVKQPMDEYGPFKLEHDPEGGQVSIWHGADLVEMLRAAGVNGLTAKQAACAVFDTEKPSTAEAEKARRRLDKLMRDHPALGIEKVEGTKGQGRDGKPTTWYVPSL
jgi:AAA domain